MNLLVSGQLVLFLCAISFRDTVGKVAPVEDPRATGQQLGPLTLGVAGEQSRRCVAPESAEGCFSSAPSHLMGEALVRREKGLSAFNWNSFGLRYGRRQAGGPRPRRARRDQGRPTAD